MDGIQAAIAGATSAQALVLIAGAAFAKSQLDEARTLRRDQTRPYVVIYIRPHQLGRWLCELVIENVGQTAAHDVTLSATPRLASSLDKDQPGDRVGDWSVFRDGVPTLAPGQKLVTLFDSFIQRFGSDLPRLYSVTLTYTGADQKTPYVDRHTIDFSVYEGAHYTTEKTIHHVAEAVEDLKKEVARWTDSGRGLLVLTQSYNERLEERHRLIEEHRSRRHAEPPPPSEAPADE